MAYIDKEFADVAALVAQQVNIKIWMISTSKVYKYLRRGYMFVVPMVYLWYSVL